MAEKKTVTNCKLITHALQCNKHRFLKYIKAMWSEEVYLTEYQKHSNPLDSCCPPWIRCDAMSDVLSKRENENVQK